MSLSHSKKVRLISEFYLRKPLDREDSNCGKLSKSSKDQPLKKQKLSNQNIVDMCNDVEHSPNKHTPTDNQKKSYALNLKWQEINENQVPKISTPERPIFVSLNCKRTAETGNNEDLRVFPPFKWKHLNMDNLKVKYCRIYSKKYADTFFDNLENEVQYLKPEDSRVQVYGKWHQIPRKHAAYGEEGVTYTYSKATLPAKNWNSCPTILELKRVAEIASGETYNFVLINRYKDGNDYMGEHKDNESDLVAKSAISSFSFGQGRDFLFKYDKNKLKDRNQSGIPSVKQFLESGSLLIMEHPTNIYWYHSLPVRKNALGVRINLTFRNIVKKS